MIRYALIRILSAIPILLGVSVVSFGFFATFGSKKELSYASK